MFLVEGIRLEIDSSAIAHLELLPATNCKKGIDPENLAISI